MGSEVSSRRPVRSHAPEPDRGEKFLIRNNLFLISVNSQTNERGSLVTGIAEESSAPARVSHVKAQSWLAFMFGDMGAEEDGWTKPCLATVVTCSP